MDTRIDIVVTELDPDDTSKVVDKLKRVPLINEKKRKMFLDEEGAPVETAPASIPIRIIINNKLP